MAGPPAITLMPADGLETDMSDMTVSVNSDASYDLDIVRHHDGIYKKKSYKKHIADLKSVRSCNLNRESAGRKQRIRVGAGGREGERGGDEGMRQ